MFGSGIVHAHRLFDSIINWFINSLKVTIGTWPAVNRTPAMSSPLDNDRSVNLMQDNNKIEAPRLINLNNNKK